MASPMPLLPPVTRTLRPSGEPGAVSCVDACAEVSSVTVGTVSATGGFTQSARHRRHWLGSSPMRAIQVSRFGGPEVLEVVDLPAPVPGPGQVLIEVATAGINYADTHQTSDDYLAPQQLPFVPGAEVVGRDGDGRRVVALLGKGGYAQQALASPARHVPGARQRRRHRGARPGRAGHDRLAPAAHQRPLRARRDRRRALRRRRRRHASPCSSPARWVRPGSSPPRRRPRSATSRGTSAPTWPSTRRPTT